MGTWRTILRGLASIATYFTLKCRTVLCKTQCHLGHVWKRYLIGHPGNHNSKSLYSATAVASVARIADRASQEF